MDCDLCWIDDASLNDLRWICDGANADDWCEIAASVRRVVVVNFMVNDKDVWCCIACIAVKYLSNLVTRETSTSSFGPEMNGINQSNQSMHDGGYQEFIHFAPSHDSGIAASARAAS